MAMPAIIAVFCDDIREEVRGTFSVIGVMPDNLQVDGVPGVIPRLAVYVRAHFDPHQQYSGFTVRLAFPNGQTLDIHQADAESVRKLQSDALAKDNPNVGLVIRAVYSPAPIPQTGRINILYIQEGEEPIICGSLNIVLDVPSAPKTVTSSTSYQPPSERSPTDAPPSSA